MIRTGRIGAIVAIMLLPAAVPASAMTVADLLGRADALKAKGALAMFQRSEIKVLTAEVQGAADAYRADVIRELP